MKWEYVIWAVASALLLATPCPAQPNPDEIQELRRQIELLQGKLQNIEAVNGASRHVTQIGAGPRQRTRETDLVVRIYDLSDLFAMALPYEATISKDLGEGRPLFPGFASQQVGGTVVPAMGMGGMGGGFFNVTKRPRTLAEPKQQALYQAFDASSRSSIDDLIEAIISTISPADWDEVGGECSIAPLGNSLTVSAYERIHVQVDDMLNLFRKRWGTLRTVSVQADWRWLAPGELETLLAAGDKPGANNNQLRAFGLVDETAWQKLVKPQGQPAGYQAIITCYNGQTVHTVSGDQSLAVTSMIPVIGGGKGDGAVGYQPRVSVIQEGAALQVTPIVSAGGKIVVLDVHSRVVKRGDDLQVDKAVLVSNAQMAAAAIDRPQLKLHQFSTTLRLPVDRRMLVGGMTCQSVPEANEPNLYLFLKVSVQELRDDQSGRPPDDQTEKKP